MAKQKQSTPPGHKRSLRGVLASPGMPSISPEDWHKAKEKAWADAVAERFKPPSCPDPQDGE
jgi:hypothetical protein